MDGQFVVGMFDGKLESLNLNLVKPISAIATTASNCTANFIREQKIKISLKVPQRLSVIIFFIYKKHSEIVS